MLPLPQAPLWFLPPQVLPPVQVLPWELLWVLLVLPPWGWEPLPEAEGWELFPPPQAARDRVMAKDRARVRVFFIRLVFFIFGSSN